MIESFTGLPGMGKTYNMTRYALKQFKKGRTVYANYHVKGFKYFKELNEVIGVKNALILIDEAGIYLPAQAWNSIPKEFVREIRQHRHDGLDMYYTAQDQQDVATCIRRVTQLQHDFTRFGKVMFEKCTNPRTGSKFGFNFSILNSKIFDLYDTKENIDFSQHIK